MLQGTDRRLTKQRKGFLASRSARVTKLTPSLWQRWPDNQLLSLFRDILPGFHRLFREQVNKGTEPAAAVCDAFREICSLLVAAAANGTPARATIDEILPDNCLARLGRGTSDLSWLQSTASLLAMLMHFSADPQCPGALVNRRRGGQPNPTYPTSAAVARLLADYVLTHLLKEPIPVCCRRAADAEHYASRALAFRLLDPSMESGQLLLELALRLVEHVHRRHQPGSQIARRLNRALLSRLCGDCLWGIDHHVSSVAAVRAVFSLLANELKIDELEPRNLLVDNSLAIFRENSLGNFDAILNNPPWGELGNSEDREHVRRFASVEYRLESYVAFTEGSLSCLRFGARFGLVLPSQTIACRNSQRLRELLTSRTKLEHLVLLPRQAFAQATVRGLVLLGRTRALARPSVASVRVTLYPLIKRLEARGEVFTHHVPLKRLREENWHALWGEAATPVKRVPRVMLGELATVVGGVTMYRQGRGQPSQTREVVDRKPYHFSEPVLGTVAAVRGRHVDEFRLRKPSDFVLLGPWLAETGSHRLLLQRERVFVREICRRDGKLNAALAVPGVLPLHSVLTVIPERIQSDLLVAILNSRVTARYVRSHTASFSKVDFQRIKIRELRRLPIPISALEARYRRNLGFGAPCRCEVGLRLRVISLARKLAVTEAPPAALTVLRERLEDLVADLYDSSQDSED